MLHTFRCNGESEHMHAFFELHDTASGRIVIEKVDDTVYYGIISCLVCASLVGLASLRQILRQNSNVSFETGERDFASGTDTCGNCALVTARREPAKEQGLPPTGSRHETLEHL